MFFHASEFGEGVAITQGRSALNGRAWLVSAAIVLAMACAHCPSEPNAPIDYWGFAGPWDKRSDVSIKQHGATLARIITGWVALDTTSFLPLQVYPDSFRTDIMVAPRTMALITSYYGSRLHPEILRGLGGSPEAAGITAGAIAALIDSTAYRGVVIDFEGMTPRDLDALLAVTRAVADSVRAHGVHTVVVAVPAGDTAAYPSALLLESADLIMAMLYDQHWSASPPGPIASPDWVARNLGTRVAEVGAARIVAAFPLYGYRWRKSARTRGMGVGGRRPRASRQARSRCETARSEKLRPLETRTGGSRGVGVDRSLNDHEIFLVSGGGYEQPGPAGA